MPLDFKQIYDPPISPDTDKFFNVKDWGAVGDGVVDDYRAIQAVLTMISRAGRGIIYFPAGTYANATSEFLVPSNCLWVGEGMGVSTIVQTYALSGHGNNRLMTNSDHTLGNSFIGFTDLTVEVPAVEGSAPTADAYGLCAQWYGVQDCTWANVEFKHGAVSSNPLAAVVNTATVHTTGKNWRHKYINCKSFDGIEFLAFVQGKGLLVRGCEAYNSYDSTISINSSGEQITIIGNLLDKELNAFNALGIIEFTNDGAGDDNGVRDVVIAGNTILNAANASSRGIEFSGGGNDVSITGNQIRNIIGNAIEASGISNLTISGNTCKGYASGSGNGIKIVTDVAATNISVVGNALSTFRGDGINISGGAEATLNVLISDNASDSNVGYGIGLGANVTNGSVTNNAVRNNTAGSINKGATTGWAIRQNRGYNPVGLFGAQPALPASNTPYTNVLQVDSTVYISGGTVTVIKINNEATGLTSGTFRVGVGESIAVVYSSAPTWLWFGE